MDRLEALEAQLSAFAQVTSEAFGRLEACNVVVKGLLPYFGAIKDMRAVLSTALDEAQAMHQAVLLNTDAETGFAHAAAELRTLLESLDGLPHGPTNGSSAL